MKAKFIKPQMVKIIHQKPEISLTFKMIKVPKGEFRRDEKTYKIDYDLEIGKYPVTVEEFRYFIEDTGYITDAEKNGGSFVWNHENGWSQDKNLIWNKTDKYFIQKKDHPITCVSYNDAIAYCEWLSKKTGNTYRLPTKNEWQYSCSGGSHGNWCFGSNETELHKYAWYNDNSERRTHSVGELKPNLWNIHDMHGHVSEWCYSQKDIGVLCGGNWVDKAKYTTTFSIKTRHQALKQYSPERKKRTLLLNEKYNKKRYQSYLDTNWYIFKEDSSYQWGFRIVKSIPIEEIEKEILVDNSENFEIKKKSTISDEISETIREKIIKQLQELGWDKDEIKQEYKLQNKHRADIVLVHQNEPVAVIEVKANLKEDILSQAKKQLSVYGKELEVKVGYITDGDKIYQYDTESVSNMQEVDSFLSVSKLLIFLGKYEEALNYHKKTLEKVLKIYGTEHPNTAMTYANIAYVHELLGQYQEALENYSITLKIKEKIFGTNHPEIVKTYNNMAGVYEKIANFTKAEKYYLKVLEIYEEVLGFEHTETAIVYNNIANIYKIKGDYKKAFDYYNKALEIDEKIFGSDSLEVSKVYNNLANLYDTMAEYGKAEMYYLKALEINEKLLGSNHLEVSIYCTNLANLYIKIGLPQKALNYYNRALEIRENILGIDHIDTATVYNGLARMYEQTRNYNEAIVYDLKALKIVENILGKNHPKTMMSYINIANVYNFEKKTSKALEYYNKALNILDNTGENIDVLTSAKLYNNIAFVYNDIGEIDKAKKFIKKAIEIREKYLPKDHVELKGSIEFLKILIDEEADKKGLLNFVKRNGTIETLDASKIKKYTMDVYKQGELEQKQKEWLANKNKNIDFLRGRKKRK